MGTPVRDDMPPSVAAVSVTRSFVWRDFAAWFGGSSEPDDEGGAGGFDDVVGDGVELERR